MRIVAIEERTIEKTTENPGGKIAKDTKRATRKQYSSEETIRIVLDGLRGEDSDCSVRSWRLQFRNCQLGRGIKNSFDRNHFSTLAEAAPMRRQDRWEVCVCRYDVYLKAVDDHLSPSATPAL